MILRVSLLWTVKEGRREDSFLGCMLGLILTGYHFGFDFPSDDADLIVEILSTAAKQSDSKRILTLW